MDHYVRGRWNPRGFSCPECGVKPGEPCVMKPRVGRTPDVLRKSGPMRDRTKYTRKVKHKGGDL